jgi:hypothetical protein
LPVTGSAVNRTARRLREDHLLHDHGHVDRPVVEAVPQAVGDGPLGEQRGPAPLTCRRIAVRPHDVQVRVVLARERGGRQVLRRRAGPDAYGASRRAPRGTDDRRLQVVRDRERFDRPAGLPLTARSPPGRRAQSRQAIEHGVDPGAAARHAGTRGRDAEPAGTRMPSIRESSPRLAPLPPASATCVRSITPRSTTSGPSAWMWCRMTVARTGHYRIEHARLRAGHARPTIVIVGRRACVRGSRSGRSRRPRSRASPRRSGPREGGVGPGSSPPLLVQRLRRDRPGS